jgi:hypothetical protein
MTSAILLAIIQSQINLFESLIASQTPAQKLLMWDRYITLTAPIHALLMRIEKVTPEEIAATNAATLAALGGTIVAPPAPLFNTGTAAAAPAANPAAPK